MRSAYAGGPTRGADVGQSREHRRPARDAARALYRSLPDHDRRHGDRCKYYRLRLRIRPRTFASRARRSTARLHDENSIGYSFTSATRSRLPGASRHRYRRGDFTPRGFTSAAATVRSTAARLHRFRLVPHGQFTTRAASPRDASAWAVGDLRHNTVICDAPDVSPTADVPPI